MKGQDGGTTNQNRNLEQFALRFEEVGELPKKGQRIFHKSKAKPAPRPRPVRHPRRSRSNPLARIIKRFRGRATQSNRRGDGSIKSNKRSSMKDNQQGYVEDWLLAGFILFTTLFVIGLFVLVLFAKWEYSEDNVSGIVYNTTNNSAISGNTKFSIRASEDTYVSQENQSSYCLPKNSPYKELVNKAAADKSIKVVVTTKRGFWVKLPWTCIDNVEVTQVKSNKGD